LSNKEQTTTTLPLILVTPPFPFISTMPPKRLPRRLDNPLIKPYKPRTVQKSSPAPHTPQSEPSGPSTPTSLPEGERFSDLASIVRAAVVLERPEHLPQPPNFNLGEIVSTKSQTKQHLEPADVEMADQQTGSGEGSVPKPSVDVEMTGMPRAVSRDLKTP